MQGGAFSHPFMYWVGMDTDPRITPEALEEFNRFYSTTHLGEVIAAHAGFLSASRYELIKPDERGGLLQGPRWLAVYEMKDEAAAQQYIKDNARPWMHRQRYSPWPPARKRAKMVWRMLWRQTSSTGSADGAPESVLLVGTNVPVPEVTALGGIARATSWELYREFAHPAPGGPRFCAIYESDSAATDGLGSGPLTSDDGDVVWRLVYRRIPPPA